MSRSDAARWDDRYRQRPATMPGPARVLAGHTSLLPERGRALDLACGRGGNALLLAALGLETHAWDISAEGLAALSTYAGQLQLEVQTRRCDLTRERPPAGEFDVIVVSYYLDRDLVPALMDALRREGLIFYQTYTRSAVTGRGPDTPEYRLQRGELLELFSGLQPVFYQELDRVGRLDRGLRDEALLIAQRSESQ